MDKRFAQEQASEQRPVPGRDIKPDEAPLAPNPVLKDEGRLPQVFEPNARGPEQGTETFPETAR